MTRLDGLRLASQELTYLAQGARVLALKARADAEKQRNPAMREIFENSERTYTELAFERQGWRVESAQYCQRHRGLWSFLSGLS
jgi:hypothetical protein